MSMDSPINFEDRLSVLGVLVGGFVIVVGFGTLLGAPWTTAVNTSVLLVQLLGIVATIAIGVVLVLVTYADDPGEILP
ncbi:MAG: hypothetical protein J07HX64_00744 [halophilic archaeon J07HX64]|jgi:hypothetical protein|nr:MAG: hypothetical protein J07HX64_00744 [halophilic archaeon J07HX64]